MQNPYICGAMTMCKIEDKIVYINSLNRKTFKEFFKNIYILYLDNNFTDDNTEISNLIISAEYYSRIKNNIVIKQIPLKFLDISKNLLTFIKEEDLLISYEPVSVVCSLININKNVINSFLTQFNGIATMTDIFNIVMLNNYLNYNDYNYIKIVNNLQESNYWCSDINCYINVNTYYDNRTFEYKFNKILDIENDKDKCYNDSLILDKNKVSSIYTRHYYISKTVPFKKSEITPLFDKLRSKIKYMLILNCLVSKDYCDIILNNNTTLEYLNQELSRNNKMYKYIHFIIEHCMSYAWLIMYIEESIKQSRIQETDRFVFPIDTASNLPYFPCYPENPNSSPYMPLLVCKRILNPINNNLGVKMQLLLDSRNNKIVSGKDINIVNNYELFDNKLLLPGIITLPVFINRLNVFMLEAIHSYNLFSNINWDNIAISGSIIACCLPRYNPLMLNTMQNNKLDFIQYVKLYYNNADLDIMCTLKGVDFIKKSYHIFNTLNDNISTIFTLVNSCTATLEENLNVKIFINHTFLLDNAITQFTLKELIDNPDNINYKTVLYEFYKTYKYEKNIKDYEKIKNDIILDQNKIDIDIGNNNIKTIDIKYKTYFNLVSIDNTSIITSKRDISLEIIENHKFKIKSDLIKRTIEIFPIRYDTFFSTVARFHLPIVRAYYSNNNVYILPSCISACMTFMNIDHRYFIFTKDPINILEKYKKRGFGTYLSTQEKKKMLSHKQYVNYFKSNEYNNELFMFKKSRKISNVYTIEQNNIVDAYIKIFNFENFNISNDNISKLIFNKNCIHPDGDVILFKKWLIEACYDL